MVLYQFLTVQLKADAGVYCPQGQSRKLEAWSVAVNILLVFQFVYSEVYSQELRGFWDTLAPGFQWERSVAEIRVGVPLETCHEKKRSDLAIKSLKRVVSLSITMGYSEEHLVGRKGIFKHKYNRGHCLGTEVSFPLLAVTLVEPQ